MNTEAKYLMLTHAFEHLGCVRVELKTDVLNNQSRSAIVRIGAKEEEFCESTHSPGPDATGTAFITAFWDEEWPQVKAHLETLLVRRPTRQ